MQLSSARAGSDKFINRASRGTIVRVDVRGCKYVLARLRVIFKVHTESYGSSFFSLIYGLGKKSVRNLQYGPQTRLVRGRYLA